MSSAALCTLDPCSAADGHPGDHGQQEDGQGDALSPHRHAAHCAADVAGQEQQASERDPEQHLGRLEPKRRDPHLGQREHVDRRTDAPQDRDIPGGRHPGKDDGDQSSTGKIANLISPLPTIAPASAAAASVAASQASVPRGSDAETTLARSPGRLQSTSPSKVTSVMPIRPLAQGYPQPDVTGDPRQTVAIIPAEARARHAPLLAALEEAYPVRFADAGGGEHGTASGVVVFPEGAGRSASPRRVSCSRGRVPRMSVARRSRSRSPGTPSSTARCTGSAWSSTAAGRRRPWRSPPAAGRSRSPGADRSGRRVIRATATARSRAPFQTRSASTSSCATT